MHVIASRAAAAAAAADAAASVWLVAKFISGGGGAEDNYFRHAVRDATHKEDGCPLVPCSIGRSAVDTTRLFVPVNDDY